MADPSRTPTPGKVWVPRSSSSGGTPSLPKGGGNMQMGPEDSGSILHFSTQKLIEGKKIIDEITGARPSIKPPQAEIPGFSPNEVLFRDTAPAQFQPPAASVPNPGANLSPANTSSVAKDAMDTGETDESVTGDKGDVSGTSAAMPTVNSAALRIVEPISTAYDEEDLEEFYREEVAYEPVGQGEGEEDDLLEIDENLPPHYPPVENVLDSPDAITFLKNTGLLRELQVVNYGVLLNASPRNIVVEPYVNIQLSAYDQLVMAVIDKYYAGLPEVSFDMDTHRVAHMLNLYFADEKLFRAGPEKDYSRLLETMSMIVDEHLTDVFIMICHLVIPAAQLGMKSPFAQFTLPKYKDLMNRLRAAYPPLKTAYNMAFQLVHGSSDCIAPIPPILHMNYEVAAYVNAIAQGGEHISTEEIMMNIRDPGLEVFIPPVHTTAKIAPLQQRVEAGATKNQATQAEKPKGLWANMMAKQAAQEASSSSAGANVAVTNAPQPVRLVKPSEFLAPPPKPTPANVGKQAYQNVPTQLLPQGAPTGVAPIRNTTAFVESVNSNAETQSTLQMLVQTTLDIKNSLQDYGRRIDHLEGSIGNIITHAAAHDLDTRLNLNRTVMETHSQEAAELIQNAPMISTPVPDELKVFIARLKDPDSVSKYPGLGDEIKAYLVSKGKMAEAGTITGSFLRNNMARRMLAQTLQKL